MQSSTVIFLAVRFTACVTQLISRLRPSASLTAYTIRAVLSGVACEFSPSSMFSLHLSSLQNDDLYDFDILSSMIRHTEPSQSGLCAPCVGLFVFLFVLFHKGHELVWSPVMAERPLCHGWRATDLKPCFLSCSWVELGVQYNFLLPAR